MASLTRICLRKVISQSRAPVGQRAAIHYFTQAHQQIKHASASASGKCQLPLGWNTIRRWASTESDAVREEDGSNEGKIEGEPDTTMLSDLGHSEEGLNVEEVDLEKIDPKIVKVCDDVMSLNVVEMIMMLHVIDHRTGGLLAKDFGSWNMGRPGGVQAGGGGGAVGAGAPGAGSGEAQAPTKDTFELKVIGFDAKGKIKVIKEVRAISGLGLKEAKEVVESLPKVIKKDLKKEEAEELMEKLKAAGAEVELV